MIHQIIDKMAAQQNWAKLTPWLGIFMTVVLFKFTSPDDARFWALVDIPLYLFHQMEEHYIPGGFKQYINHVINKLPPGQEFLTDIKVFWINILLVWMAFIIFGLLSLQYIGFGLLIIIFSMINCVTHIVTALKHREWNPGLVMASIQFLISIYAAYFISAHAQIAHLPIWWLATIIFSIVVHLGLFKLAMSKN